MRRKIFAIATSILAIGTSFFGTSCDAFVDNTPTEEPKETNPFVQTLNDFETLADLYCNDYDNGQSLLYFGRVNLNKEAKYVTSGKSSICLDVHGTYAAGGQPTVAAFKFVKDGKYIDFSRLKKMTFDFFNETGEEQVIGVALGFDGKKSNYQYMTVKMGLNKIEFLPDLLGLSIAGNLTKGESLLVDFAKPDMVIGEAPFYRYYMDNLQMEYAIKSVSGIDIVVDENAETGVTEFTSFEKYYQQYIVEPYAFGPSYTSLPTLTINSNPLYSKGGVGKSLKVAYPISEEPMNDGWPGFAFIDMMWEEFDLTQMAADGKEFVFDIYNPGSDYSFGFYVKPKIANKSTQYSKSCPVKGGQWTEIRVPLSDLNAFMAGEGENTLKVNLTDNIGKVYFLINKTPIARTFYFDNFRFENKK